MEKKFDLKKNRTSIDTLLYPCKSILFTICIILITNTNGFAQWKQMPGKANDIAIGGNPEQIWIIGFESRGGGNQIQRWTGTSWEEIDGGAVKIAVDGMGMPWVVNNDGQIFKRRLNNTWVEMPGRARDIAIGGGVAWIIGTDAYGSGHRVYYWGESKWIPVDAGAVDIAVNAVGTVHMVDAGGNIWSGEPVLEKSLSNATNSSTFVKSFTKGKYQDDYKATAVAGGGTPSLAGGHEVWYLSNRPESGGYSICRRISSSLNRNLLWNEYSGGAKYIAVNNRGLPVVVNVYGDIFFWDENINTFTIRVNPLKRDMCPFIMTETEHPWRDYLPSEKNQYDKELKSEGATNFQLALAFNLDKGLLNLEVVTSVKEGGSSYDRIEKGIGVGKLTRARGITYIPVVIPLPGKKIVSIANNASFSNSYFLEEGGRFEPLEGCDGPIVQLNDPGYPIKMIQLVGDTGGEDIAIDTYSCECNSRINYLELVPIKVTMAKK
ncbi:MAG: hypothetical protein K9J37_04400 [Saprospiraceae bacterium]|nr:hypothetical protein [Saprospiraceae bacterium]MCF8249126.1 hypothetical protein [Saprospiraceae bacterium]MCF8281383.1 hypothetical protein [Bacteroidales bacterium]MCF8311148.1 hypothetical protein [Saprospiraceae bacterium]MCF8440238.1 hypothetical protein [Saprospiraceae bacterium]